MGPAVEQIGFDATLEGAYRFRINWWYASAQAESQA